MQRHIQGSVETCGHLCSSSWARYVFYQVKIVQRMRTNITEWSSSCLPSLQMLARRLSLAERIAGRWQTVPLRGVSEMQGCIYKICRERGRDEAAHLHAIITQNGCNNLEKLRKQREASASHAALCRLHRCRHLFLLWFSSKRTDSFIVLDVGLHAAGSLLTLDFDFDLLLPCNKVDTLVRLKPCCSMMRGPLTQ